MRDYRDRFRERAAFLPAIQNGYHSLPYKNPTSIRQGLLPSGMTALTELDFLGGGNPFFAWDRVLISAGQYPTGRLPPGMIRKQPGALIMGDSGGYQLATGVIDWKGDESRATALDFAERYTDVCPILDIPTRAIDPSHAVFNSFQACLYETRKSAEYAAKHRRGAARILGVLQGRSRDEADEWDEAMMALPFEGWAIGGDLRLDMYETGRRVARLVERGLIDGQRNHLHIFGTGMLAMAVMLTALQQGLRERFQTDDIVVTFDCSSPSMLMTFSDGYAGATLGGDGFSYKTVRLPNSYHNIGLEHRFPVPASSVGSWLKVSDLCVSSTPGKTTAWDSLSEALVTNHNTEMALIAIDEANCRLEQRQADAEKLAPIALVRACRALRTMFQSPDPIGRLDLVRRELKEAAGKPFHLA